MKNDLDAVELRVLGCLLEKELATPEYYPLSLNALLNACNQKTNRAPVMQVDEAAVLAALKSLKQRRYVYQSDAGRVPKYWQSFAKDHDLDGHEAALLSVLLLRGPQTAGELRLRADSLCPFDSLEQVGATLDHLIAAGMAAQLARQPGQKEQRAMHLLAAPVGEPGPAIAPPGRPESMAD
ncbi:MAG: YceH family protein, partial [Proteobacteria bacterium]|nr:YceH family protein [Pseudomonadota bacterium]